MTLLNCVGAGVVWCWVGTLASPWVPYKHTPPPNRVGVGTLASPWVPYKRVTRPGDREGRPYISAPQSPYMKCRDTPGGCPEDGCPACGCSDVLALRILNTRLPFTYTSGGTKCQTTTI